MSGGLNKTRKQPEIRFSKEGAGSGPDFSKKGEARYFYINLDFDFRLGGILPKPSWGRRLAAGKLHFLPAGNFRDFLQTEYRPPSDFLEYLDSLEISHCRVGLDPFNATGSKSASAAGTGPTNPSSYTCVPFGWDREAMRFGKSFGKKGAPDPPSYAAVRKANDRKFLQELSREEEPGESRFVSHPDASSFERIRRQLGGVLRVKSRHGHAGMGHYRLPPGGNLPQSWVRFWRAHRGVVVEKQREPVLNIGSLWELGEDGRIKNLSHHKLLVSSDGSYRGAVLPSDWKPRQHEVLLQKIETLNNRLYREGYYGPVELDSFYYQGDKGLSLRVYVDCNARLTLLHPAYAYKKNLTPGADLLWKVYPASKGEKAVGPDFWKPLFQAFRKAFPHGEAVMATPPLAKKSDPPDASSPVTGAGGPWIPLPFVMAIHGEGEEDLARVENRVRSLLEKHGF